MILLKVGDYVCCGSRSAQNKRSDNAGVVLRHPLGSDCLPALVGRRWLGKMADAPQPRSGSLSSTGA